ncbi:MAG: hypothetical protein JST54_35660 [Deltaproteobacteria bacterium]|nr:hypothetical protein [Deltaproteobacteria bacterium]
MRPDRTEDALRQLHPPGDSPDAAAREALEARLLARFDQLHPSRRSSMSMYVALHKRGLTFAAIVLVALGIGSQAPAEITRELGTRLELTVAEGKLPAPDKLVDAVLGKAGEPSKDETGGFGGSEPEVRGIQVEAQLEKHDGQDHLTLSIWGASPPAGIAERVHKAFPELLQAPVAVSSIEGQVHTNVLGKLESKVLGRDKLSAEELRRQVQATLKAQGHDHADVQVVDEDGKRKVMVRVHELH